MSWGRHLAWWLRHWVRHQHPTSEYLDLVSGSSFLMMQTLGGHQDGSSTWFLMSMLEIHTEFLFPALACPTTGKVGLCGVNQQMGAISFSASKVIMI